MATPNTEPARPGYEPGMPAEIDEQTRTVVARMLHSIRSYPDRKFCDFLGSSITYREIGAQISQAASVLYVAGVRRGDRVSLIMPNCPQHVVAFYAALRLGAIVAEHNPLAPDSELHTQLALAQPRVVIAWEKTIEKVLSRPRVPEQTIFSVDLTAHMPLRSRLLLALPIKAARTQRENLRSRVPDGVVSWEKSLNPAFTIPRGLPWPEVGDTAVLIFTGGTTGTPKAVELTHLNIVANAMQCRTWLPKMNDGEETILAALPFFHAFGLTLSLTLSPILAATIVIVPRFDVDLVLAAHARTPMTFIGGVPPMFDRLTTAAAEQGVDLSSIRFSVSGAMSLDEDIARRWEEHTGGLLIEGYGMSECSPVITGNPVGERRRPGTLGLPFPSTWVRVCDPENPEVEVPVGQIGELQVRGLQVMRGYYKDPEATREVFTSDGWLRTGDLVVIDESGWITMQDRLKEVIIFGGFNIYPSQVEDAVRDMPGVTDVAVVGLPDGSRGEKVVAALVMAPGAAADLAAVRAWAEKKVSHYALPRQVEVLDELPRSAIGKPLRRRVAEQLRNAGERFEDAKVHAEEYFDEARQQAGERFDDARERAGERFDDARERLVEHWHSAEERFDEVLQQWQQRRRDSDQDAEKSPQEGEGSDLDARDEESRG